ADDGVLVRVELLFVDAHDIGGHLVGALGGGGDQDTLGAAGDVLAGSVEVGEQAGGLDDVVDAHVAPGKLGGVAFGEAADLVAVDDHAIIAGDFDGAVEAA